MGSYFTTHSNSKKPSNNRTFAVKRPVATSQLTDNRPEALWQRKIQTIANNFSLSHPFSRNNDIKTNRRLPIQNAIINSTCTSPLQLKWVDDPTIEYYQWVPLINGLLWLQHKTEDLTYYMIMDKEAFERAYGKETAMKWAKNQGIAKPYAEWEDLEEGEYEDEDIIERIPEEEIPRDKTSKLSSWIIAHYPTLKGYEDLLLLQRLPSAVFKRIFDVCIMHHIPDETAEKSFNIENLVTGIRIGLQQFPPYFHYVLGALMNDENVFRTTFDAIVYTTYKNRWSIEFFIPIIEGMVFDETLEIPRGFQQNPVLFNAFKEDYRKLLNQFGDDIRIQGSTTIPIPGEVKDIDIAILVDTHAYNEKIKRIHAQSIAAALKMEGRNVTEPIDDNTLKFIVKQITNQPDRYNSRQKSLAYIYCRGFIKHSDFMSKAEKKIRDALNQKWMEILKLKDPMDISIIKKGSSFDKGPYIRI